MLVGLKRQDIPRIGVIETDYLYWNTILMEQLNVLVAMRKMSVS
jgi:hypothetical protein